MTPAIPHRPPAWSTECRETLRLAAPMALTQLVQFSMHVTDTLMIGRLGKDALAAGGLGTTIFYMAVIFCLGVVAAVAPLAAQAHGARKARLVRRTVRQGLWVATLLGAIFIAVLWHTEFLLALLGQDPANTAGAQSYVRAAVWGMIPILWNVALRGFISVMGRPNVLLAVMSGGFCLNILGNWVLMFGHWGFPRLELAGVGLSTAIANVAMTIALLLFATRARRIRRYAILGRFWRPDWHLFREIFKLGLPISGMMMMEHSLFAAAVFLLGKLGTAQLAAHMIAINCAATSFMIPLGIGQAATIRVGLAIGRGDSAGARRAGWAALGLGMLFMIAPAILFAVFPMTLIGLFIDLAAPENAAVIGFAASFLGIAALFQIFDGGQCIAAHILRGRKDTRTPMALACLGYLGVGLSASYLLGFHSPLGGAGVWWGLLIGLAVVTVMLVIRIRVTTGALSVIAQPALRRA